MFCAGQYTQYTLDLVCSMAGVNFSSKTQLWQVSKSNARHCVMSLLGKTYCQLPCPSRELHGRWGPAAQAGPASSRRCASLGCRRHRDTSWRSSGSPVTSRILSEASQHSTSCFQRPTCCISSEIAADMSAAPPSTPCPRSFHSTAANCKSMLSA